MFEQLMTLVFLAPVAPSDTWSNGTNSVSQAQTTPIRLNVNGPARPGCSPYTLALPPSIGGTMRFEQRGVRYSGTETAAGSLVLRGTGPQPLTLSGSRADGGLWSLGTDGRCVGTWKRDQPLNAKRE